MRGDLLRRRSEETLDARVDKIVDFDRGRQIEQPSALAEIEGRAEHAAHQLDLENGKRHLVESGQATLMAQLGGDARINQFAISGDEALVIAEIGKAREGEEPNPLEIVHDAGIVVIETADPPLEALAAINEPIGPSRIPEFVPTFLVDVLDQRVLAGEITVDQGLRDAEALCQLARLAVETLLGKKPQRMIDDEAFALLRCHPRARNLRTRGSAVLDLGKSARPPLFARS